ALTQIVVPVGIEDAVGRCRREISQIEQLGAEVVDQRVRAMIGQHPPHLLLEYHWRAQASLARDRNQLVVWNAAPEKEGEARRQLEIRDAIRAACCRGFAATSVGRFAFRTHQKLRTCEQTSKRELDSVVERSRMTAFRIE